MTPNDGEFAYWNKSGEAWFTTGTEATRPKLRRGFYFIAVGDLDDRREPDWHRYRFRATGPEVRRS